MFTIIAHDDDHDDVTNAGDGEKIVNEVENVFGQLWNSAPVRSEPDNDSRLNSDCTRFGALAAPGSPVWVQCTRLLFPVSPFHRFLLSRSLIRIAPRSNPIIFSSLKTLQTLGGKKWLAETIYDCQGMFSEQKLPSNVMAFCVFSNWSRNIIVISRNRELKRLLQECFERSHKDFPTPPPTIAFTTDQTKEDSSISAVHWQWHAELG